jgi:phospholipase/carboxylesterase
MISTERSPAHDPHHDQPVRLAGAPLEHARAALLMLHGRGAHAEDILSLTAHLDLPGFAFLAPQAANDTWYPNRFSAPLASNEPWLSSALAYVGAVFARITAAGIPPERTLLLGFSQGACLALEFAARNARRYGGLAGLGGALIGPAGASREDGGSLAGTPIFLGCSDVDPHVPKERVQQAAEVLQRLGGQVTLQFFANMDHSVNSAELDFVRRLMQAVLPAP